jgi:YD repeat-containing protein
MTERPEPFLFERVWAHPSSRAPEDAPTTTAMLDDAGRLVGARYSDGEEESYEYDADGRLVAIKEADSLAWAVSENAQRVDTGGRLSIEHDEEGPLRIVDEWERTVWERPGEPFETLFERGIVSFERRCVEALARVAVDPDTQIQCMRLIYVDDGDLHTIITVLTEDDRERLLQTGGAFDIACGLWYPESEPVGFLEVEDHEDDQRLLRETALNDPRDAKRVVLNAVAKRLAHRDWSGVFTPTEDFLVFIAEHDEGFAPKYESVLEVNPPERLAAWDARWPAGASRGEDD